MTRTVGGFISGLIASTLFTFGMSWSIIQCYKLDALDFWGALLISLAASLALMLLFFNWWTTLGTLVLLNIGALIVAIYFWGRGDAFLEMFNTSVAPFVNEAWWFLRGEIFMSPEFAFPMCVLVCVFTAVISRPTAGRLSGAWLLAPLAIALFVAEWLLGHRGIIPEALIAALGVIVAYSGSARRRMLKVCARKPSRMGGMKVRIAGKTLGMRGHHIRLAARPIKFGSQWAGMYALAIALILAVPALIFSTGFAQSFRNPGVQTVVGDINDVLSEYTGFKTFRSSFTLASTGFQPRTASLGGPISPLDIPVMEIYSDTDLHLLRGSVYDVYTGKAWIDRDGVSSYRLDNPMFAKEKQDAFDLLRPPASTDLGSRLYEPTQYRVTVLSGMHTSLFTSGRVTSIVPADNSPIIPMFDDQGEAFSKNNYGIDDSYIVSAYQLRTGASNFDKLMSAMLSAGSEHGSFVDSGKAEQIDSYALQLPEDLPDTVREAAGAMTKKAQRSYDAAVAIRNSLNKNNTYNLKAKAPPPGTDFVEWFLQTKEGYCTYFATAMAVLARAEGIPSRYVEGFSISSANRTADGTYIVRSNNAHAWAELYFDGVGWIPFDATPAAPRGVVNPSPTPLPATPKPIPTPAVPVVTPPAEVSPPVPSGDHLNPDEEFGRLGTVISIAAIGLAVSLLLVLIILLVSKRIKFNPSHVRDTIKRPADRSAHYWQGILAILSKLGLHFSSSDTPYDMSDRAGIEAESGPDVRHAADILVKSRYGNQPPTDDDLASMDRIYHELDGSLKRKLGIFKYTIWKLTKS